MGSAKTKVKSGKREPTKSKVGLDGKTKQQRYVERNRKKVNEDNRRRARERREQLLLSNVATSQDQVLHKDDFGDGHNTDEDLAELDRADKAHADSVMEVFDHVSVSMQSIMFDLGQQWSFSDGWTDKLPFSDSRIEKRILTVIEESNDLNSELIDLLESYPPGTDAWEGTLEMIRWLAGTGTILDRLQKDLAASE